MRDAKSVEIIQSLLEKGAQISAFDPIAMENTRKIFGDQITYKKNVYEVAEGVDALILVTEWNQFKHLNLEKLRNLMKTPILFDGRNIYKPEPLQALGFEYHSIGRKNVLSKPISSPC